MPTRQRALWWRARATLAVPDFVMLVMLAAILPTNTMKVASMAIQNIPITVNITAMVLLWLQVLAVIQPAMTVFKMVMRLE